MKSPFDKNIEFLASHFPHLLKKILPSGKVPGYKTDGTPPNIYFKNHGFHSKNPEKEAARSIENIPAGQGILILFLGLGMGYAVERFFQSYDIEGVQPIIIEKSAEAFTLLVHTRDISFLKNTRLFIDEDPSSLIEYFETIDPLAFKGYRIIRLRGAFEIYRDYYTHIQSTFTRHMSGRLSDMLTRFSFEALWLKNFILNIPHLAGKSSIAALKGSLASSPALVIAAGPSLKRQLPLISRISQDVHIIAVDTVVGPLVARGIVPDYIITLDAQYYNTFDFFPLFSDKRTAEHVYRNSALVADIVTCPQILENWRGEIFFSETANTSDIKHPDFSGGDMDMAHSLSPLLHDYFSDIGLLECGGSVATTAVEFALYLGAGPIFITGFDLAYTGYETHVAGSPQYNELLRIQNRLTTLQTLTARSIRGRKITSVMGKNGKPVVTDFVFRNYLKWLESRKARYRSVVNVTDSGMKIEGIGLKNIVDIITDVHSGRKKSDTRTRIITSRNRNDFSDGGMSPKHGNQLTQEAARQFLCALKQESDEAKSRLGAVGFDMHQFMDRFGFLRNSTLCAKRLYENDSSIKDHLLRLILYLERCIEKSCMKLTGSTE